MEVMDQLPFTGSKSGPWYRTKQLAASLLAVRWRGAKRQFDTYAVTQFSNFAEKIAVMTLVNPDDNKNKSVAGEGDATIKVKTPKRILHFSDGILEEYSSDEEVDSSPKEEQPVVDPSSLTWGPWMWYKAWRAGAGTLAVVDSMGEFLAAFFGITTPKYYFELEEYKKREAEANAEKEKKQGWSEASTENFNLKEINTNQPRPVDV